MSACFCIGKLKGCTCGGRCACACTCATKFKEFEFTPFEDVFTSKDDSDNPERKFTQPPNCS